jgi:antitoxin PrlF
MARSIPAKLTSKGQVTIPLEVRERLGLQTGDRLLFVVSEEGRVQLAKVQHHTLDDVVGLLGRPPRRVTPAQMDAAIRRHVTKRARRR